jgi:hypothetical protein
MRTRVQLNRAIIRSSTCPLRAAPQLADLSILARAPQKRALLVLPEKERSLVIVHNSRERASRSGNPGLERGRSREWVNDLTLHSGTHATLGPPALS